MRLRRKTGLRNGHKYAEETEKKKIVFQFALMLISAIIGGFCFSNLLSDSAVSDATLKMTEHFGVSLIKGADISDAFLGYVRFCLPDMICVLLLFVFSFSFVNYVVSDAVLVFLGVRYGINSAIIRIASFSVIGVGNSLAYWLLRAATLALFMIFSCRMAFYSLTLRRFSANGRLMIDKRALLSQVLYALTVLGSVFMINGLYCVFVFVL